MLIASIIPTETALKNTFNDDGTRKGKIRGCKKTAKLKSGIHEKVSPGDFLPVFD